MTCSGRFTHGYKWLPSAASQAQTRGSSLVRDRRSTTELCHIATINIHRQKTLVFTCVSYAEARNRYRLDVRPSVRPSVTRWYCIKTAEYIVMFSSPHDSPFILVLCVSRSSRNSDGVTPCGVAKQRWGLKISQFSTNNSIYLRNG